MLSNPCVHHESSNPKAASTAEKASDVTLDGQRNERMKDIPKESVGVIDVCIHQARDIHNICIYHKQDVYSKLSLTSDPEISLSTQIINGGGKNPVFNERFRLNVSTIDSSVKCEIWMLSRVKNYLQDQLLGFTLVPLSDVLVANGKLEREFSLTSSDLFHSPAGFVQLTLTYTGATPDVLEIPKPHSPAVVNITRHVSGQPNSEPCELEKIEFPDPCIVKENEMMVSEYFGIPCAELESKSAEGIEITDNNNHPDSDSDAHISEGFSTGDSDTNFPLKIETPPSSVSTNGPPLNLVHTGSQLISDTSEAVKSPNQDVNSSSKEKSGVIEKVENGSSEEPVSSFPQPVISVNVEPAPKLVQQEIVDMYMKSMQQFTEALAKMKLPLDVENSLGNKSNSDDSGNSPSDEKAQSSKRNGPSPRVFYGSRAFF